MWRLQAAELALDRGGGPRCLWASPALPRSPLSGPVFSSGKWRACASWSWKPFPAVSRRACVRVRASEGEGTCGSDGQAAGAGVSLTA